MWEKVSIQSPFYIFQPRPNIWSFQLTCFLFYQLSYFDYYGVMGVLEKLMTDQISFWTQAHWISSEVLYQLNYLAKAVKQIFPSHK